MRLFPAVGALCLLAACTRDTTGDSSGDTISPAIADSGTLLLPDAVAACFVSAQSVLARGPDTAAPGPAGLRGWIRLDRFTGSDSAEATLVDSDGFALGASWLRRGDSVNVAGSNDFVRIDLRLRVSDSVARGSMRAHSDAALERDSAGKLREFLRTGTIEFRRVSCDRMPRTASSAAIDVLPHGSPRPGIRFDPSTVRPGSRVGALVLDSIDARQAVGDSTWVGIAKFSGEIELRGWTLRHPDPDLYPVLTCFEADSASATQLPRWSGDERRSWFCFENRSDATRALGPPSEGERATITVDRFTIHRGLSDQVNSARLLRLVRRGPG